MCIYAASYPCKNTIRCRIAISAVPIPSNIVVVYSDSYPDSRPVYESGYPAITPDVLQPLPSSQAPVRFLAEVFSNLFQLPELRGVSWNTLDTQVRYGSPSAQSQVSLGSPLYHRSHAMVQCEVKIPNRAHRPARSWMTAGDTGIA